MKKCPKCQKNMSDSSAFCDMCGTVLEEVLSDDDELEKVSTIPPVSKEEMKVVEEEEISESPEELLSNVEKHGRSFFQPVSEDSEDEESPATIEEENTEDVVEEDKKDTEVASSDEDDVKETEEENEEKEKSEKKESSPSTVPAKTKKKKTSKAVKAEENKEGKESEDAKEVSDVEDKNTDTEITEEAEKNIKEDSVASEEEPDEVIEELKSEKGKSSKKKQEKEEELEEESAEEEIQEENSDEKEESEEEESQEEELAEEETQEENSDEKEESEEEHSQEEEPAEEENQEENSDEKEESEEEESQEEELAEEENQEENSGEKEESEEEESQEEELAEEETQEENSGEKEESEEEESQEEETTEEETQEEDSNEVEDTEKELAAESAKNVKKDEKETNGDSEEESAEKPVVEDEPKTEPVTEPVVEPKTEPATVPVTKPVEPKTEPLVMPKVEPPPTIHPVVTAATQPVVVQPMSSSYASLSSVQPETYSSVTSVSQGDIDEEYYDEDEEDINVKISFVIGIISLLLSLVGMWPIAVIGYIVGYVSKEDSPRKRKALIINAIAIGVGVVTMIIYFSVVHPNGEDVSDDSMILYGEGYSLKYNSPWTLASVGDNKVALKYGDEDSYFSPVGHSNLDVTIDCDFKKDSCKIETYNDFYDHWSSSIDSALSLSKESSFYLLKDDIYYATYNYAVKETGEQKGKYYLIISEEKNAVLSFISAGDSDNLAALNPNIIKLMETIEIEDKPRQDEKASKTLDQLSNWNLYSDLRKDTHGRKKTLSGSFRILSDTSSYWVFKNGKFWWYKSEADLDDNYWSGTYTFLTGKKGLKSVGLPGDSYDKLIGQSKGKISSGDVYSIIMKPNKIISNGEDKSKTNIPKGTEWKFVWIIVDHGEDGIEAQVLNISKNEKSYFVKVSD